MLNYTSMKRVLTSVYFRVIVSLALIVILLYIVRDKYGAIASALKGTDLNIFSVALALFFSAIALASCRLLLIIRAQSGGLAFTFRESFSLTLIGYFFNNFLPTAIGGDVAKAYYLSKMTSDNIGSITSIFMDRLIGLATMIFMAAGALLFIQSSIIDSSVRNMLYVITLIAVIAVAFMANRNFARKFSWLLFLVNPIKDKLKDAYNAANNYKNNKTLLAKTLAISIVSQLFFYASFGMAAFSMGYSISSVNILLRMPVVGMMSLLPSLNGLGLREGATVLLFGPLIGNGNAFAVSILWILVLLVASLVGGLIYALSPQFKVKLKTI